MLYKLNLEKRHKLITTLKHEVYEQTGEKLTFTEIRKRFNELPVEEQEFLINQYQ